MRAYILWALLSAVMAVPVLAGACTPASMPAPPTNLSSAPNPVSIPAQRPSLAMALPVLTIEKAPGAAWYVAENNETNNVKTVALSTTAPDLIVENITWSPENLSRGDNVAFSVVIKNQGGGEAPPSRVNFYINGTSRGYKEVQSIGAGANVTKTFTWTAQAGSHAIKAVADGANHVIESDETNNAKVATFSTIAPDLVVQNIT
ncbi:CARDB domain-containing protein [Chloroflexota bacterium]